MKNYIFNHTRKKQLLLFSVDLVLIMTAWLSAPTAPFTFLPSMLLSMLLTFLMYLFNQYDLHAIGNVAQRSTPMISKILAATIGASITAAVLSQTFFDFEAWGIRALLTSLLLIMWRYAAVKYLLPKIDGKRLALVGNRRALDALTKDMRSFSNGSFVVSKTYGTDDDHLDAISLAEFLRSGDFDLVAFDATDSALNDGAAQEILRFKFLGREVHDLSRFYEDITGKVPLMLINGQWLMDSPEFHGMVSKTYVRAKRVMDILLSTFLAAALWPLVLFLAVVVKLGSKGPVFFVQERLGKDFRPFLCYKFRTMIDDAEKSCGPVWATDSDPRITRMGRILRKTRLDELPQIWNVLKGDMSLVGPRPIRECFAKELEALIPFYRLRFGVKPGLTGWAQVNHDYAGSTEGQLEKFQYELFYIRHMSLFLDIVTMIKTVKTVISRQGT